MEELTTAWKCVASWNASTVGYLGTKLLNIKGEGPKGEDQEVGKPIIKEKEHSQETIKTKGLEEKITEMKKKNRH